MSGLRRLPKTTGLLLCCGASLLLSPAIRAADRSEITAVSSKVSDDYVRTKLPSGAFETETYSFGEGGRWGGPMHDDTVDRLSFFDVARAIAGPLANQNYRPITDPGRTKLLIMVYWGTTAGTSDGASSSIAYQNLSASQSATLPPSAQQVTLANGRSVGTSSGSTDLRKSAQQFDDNAVFMVATMNAIRKKADIQNARLLGYDDALMAARGQESTALRFRQTDLLEEIEENRYFVVLMAYDFQLLFKEKKHKLLWETRFSIREHRNDFSQQLAGMAESASKYFGQDTHGVLRKPLPEGRVTLGELKVIETVPDKAPEKVPEK